MCATDLSEYWFLRLIFLSSVILNKSHGDLDYQENGRAYYRCECLSPLL